MKDDAQSTFSIIPAQPGWWAFNPILGREELRAVAVIAWRLELDQDGEVEVRPITKYGVHRKLESEVMAKYEPERPKQWEDVGGDDFSQQLLDEKLKELPGLEDKIDALSEQMGGEKIFDREDSK